MPTFPRIEACLVCEGLREEVGHKHTLLGFFGLAPHVRILLADVEVPATLCFVFCGGRGEGKVRLKLRVENKQGVEIANGLAAEIEGELVADRPNTSVFFSFQGAFGVTGIYNVVLLVNGSNYYSTTLDIAAKSLT